MGAAELLVPIRKVVLEPKSQEKRGAGTSESAVGGGWCCLEGKGGVFVFRLEKPPRLSTVGTC